jgi:DNA-binding Lrp family transcriptional regulator
MYLRKRHLFFTLILISSFIAAVDAAIDSSIINNFSTVYSSEKVPWLFSFSSFFVGLIITLLFCLIFSIPLNGRNIGSRIIDPTFQRLRFLDKSEIGYHVLAGFGNAVTTVGYFAVLSLLIDPAMVLPFKQIVILYLLTTECIVEKNTPTFIEIQSSVIVMFGAILSSISFTGDINVEAILIMFIVVNPGIVFLSICQRKLMLLKIKEKSNDSINIRLWNLVFTFGFISLFLMSLDLFNGTSYILEGIEASLNFFWPVTLSMTVVLFSALTYIRSLRIGKTSVAQAIRASIILFSIPISFLLAMFMYIPFPDNPTIWLIRVIGFILVILGIGTFAFSEVKAFVFIKIDPKVKIESILDNLGKIKGVESLSVVFGERYDIIAYVRSRTLMKGYTQIIQKLETTHRIKEFKFVSVLKEWEKV